MRIEEVPGIQKEIAEMKETCFAGLSANTEKKGAMETGRTIQALNAILSTSIASTRKSIKKLADKYNPYMIKRNQNLLMQELDTAVNDVKKAARETITEFGKHEKEKIKSMVTVPATEEQRTLLSTLAMRKNISQSELSFVGSAMADNYQATRLLDEIAKAQGCQMMFPIHDIDEMQDAVEKSCEYMNDLVDYMDKPLMEMPVSKHMFFRRKEDNSSIGDPNFAAWAEMLDGSRELNAITVEKTGLNAGERARVDGYFRNIRGLDSTKDKEKILQQVKNIVKEHPEDIALFRLSEYKGLVKDAEKALATTKDAEDVGKSLTFMDTKSLTAFIDHRTTGLEGAERKKTMNAIFADCPKQYKYAYDYAQAYGEDVSFTGDGGASESGATE